VEAGKWRRADCFLVKIWNRRGSWAARLPDVSVNIYRLDRSVLSLANSIAAAALSMLYTSKIKEKFCYHAHLTVQDFLLISHAVIPLKDVTLLLFFFLGIWYSKRVLSTIFVAVLYIFLLSSTMRHECQSYGRKSVSVDHRGVWLGRPLLHKRMNE